MIVGNDSGSCQLEVDEKRRNPFAAVWGVRDRDDIIWLMGERYRRQEPLAKHADHLPREVMWYADPSGANEIASLRCAGFLVRKGNNALQPGIGAVAARLREGTLRVLAGRCPNLLAEAELYRYGTGHSHDPESPVDEHNHALAALRYLVASMDATRLALSPEKRRERAA